VKFTNFKIFLKFSKIHYHIVATMAVFYPQWQCRHVLCQLSFWRLLICFVIKLSNSAMNGNNGLLLILTPNNTDLSLTCHCWMFLWLRRSVIIIF